MKRNCVNCGAPIDIDVDRCPYCKTSYFDMTAIDFSKPEPVALKIRNGNMVITQLVRPVCGSMEYRHDTIDVAGPLGTIGRTLTQNCFLETNIQFEAVPFPNKNHLVEVIVYDK